MTQPTASSGVSVAGSSRPHADIRRRLRSRANDGILPRFGGTTLVDDSISLHVLKLRIRNNIIDYLELASSPDEQREYERRVPIAQVPNEMINQWEDCVPDADFDWYCEPEYSLDEQDAIRRFHQIWSSVADETPDEMPPTIGALIGTPVWQRLTDGAGEALRVFRARGRIDEALPL
jgi:hypothetical protein